MTPPTDRELPHASRCRHELPPERRRTSTTRPSSSIGHTGPGAPHVGGALFHWAAVTSARSPSSMSGHTRTVRSVLSGQDRACGCAGWLACTGGRIHRHLQLLHRRLASVRPGPLARERAAGPGPATLRRHVAGILPRVRFPPSPSLTFEALRGLVCRLRGWRDRL